MSVGSRLGGFLLTGEIARGGMGVVYEGLDRTGNQRVALKTVRTTSSVMLSSMRREIETLSRLRHPSVVRIVDHGVENGLPWYAMELLEGQTLQDYLDGVDGATGDSAATTVIDLTFNVDLPDSGDGVTRTPVATTPGPMSSSDGPAVLPQRVVRGLQIARRLCAPLGFLHGEGIVHRDLKPANIFLRAGDQPVLVDFGMVQSFGGVYSRERLADAEGPRGGSVAYIPPEQIAGELVDPRSDLYSLGAILYQIITGRPPFVGKPSEVITMHLTAKPMPPSTIAPWLPPTLDDLVCRLLEKQPRLRVGHAADVARLIGECVPALVDDEFLSLPPARPYIYRPALIGRREVMDSLAEIIPRRDDRHPAVVLIEGARGTGKTRLAAELASIARQRRVRVIKSECLPLASGAGAPLSAFRPALQAVADHCREHGTVEIERILGPRAGLLAAYEPTLAVLPEVVVQPARLDSARAERQRLYTWFASTMAAFSLVRSVLLLVDDLQWADELSLGLLESLGNGRVSLGDTLVVGTCHARIDSLSELRAQPRVRRVPLGPLPDNELASLVGEMLAMTKPPAALVEELARASAGNPFYVGEYLHAAVATGDLRRDRHGQWITGQGDGPLDLPRSLEDLITRRMDTFGPIERELFEIAAVIGTDVPGDLWLAVGRHPENEVLLATAHLLARDVLSEISPGQYRFTHGSLREAIYERLPGPRRRDLHHRVAAALSQRKPIEPRALAHHYEAAGESSLAFPWLIRAGIEAQRKAAPADARALLERAFELQPQALRGDLTRSLSEIAPGLSPGDILAAYAAALRGTGELDRASVVTQDALSQLGVTIPQSRRAWIRRALQELGQQAVGRYRGHADKTRPRDRASTAPELSKAPSNSASDILRMRLLTQLNTLYAAQAARLPQIGTSLIAVNLAERGGGQASSSARPYGQVASLTGMLGLEAVSRHYLERAHAASRGAGGRDRQYVYQSETLVGLCRGRWQSMQIALRRGLEAAKEVGDFQTMGSLYLLQSGAAAVRGDPSTGLPAVHRGLRITRRHGYVMEEGLLLLNGAMFELLRRDLNAARGFLDQAAPHAQVTGDPVSAALLATNRALASLLADERDEARAYADAAMAEIKRGRGSPGFITALLRLPGVYLALSESARAPDGAMKATQIALNQLARAAYLQPGARPTLLLFQAQKAHQRGQARRARRLLRRALQEARARDIPYAEATALALVTTIEPNRAGEPDRAGFGDRGDDRARALVRNLGAAWPPLYSPNQQDPDP